MNTTVKRQTQQEGRKERKGNPGMLDTGLSGGSSHKAKHNANFSLVIYIFPETLYKMVYKMLS